MNAPELQGVADAVLARAESQGFVVPREIRDALTGAGLPDEQWKEVVAIAKQRVGDLLAEEAPQNLRLEGFLYDDHLAVWTLTIGFELAGNSSEPAQPQPRSHKIVRVSQADKSVLSVVDR